MSYAGNRFVVDRKPYRETRPAPPVCPHCHERRRLVDYALKRIYATCGAPECVERALVRDDA